MGSGKSTPPPCCSHRLTLLHLPCTYPALTLQSPTYPAVTTGLPCTYPALTLHLPCSHRLTLQSPPAYPALTLQSPTYPAVTTAVPCSHTYPAVAPPTYPAPNTVCPAYLIAQFSRADYRPITWPSYILDYTIVCTRPLLYSPTFIPALYYHGFIPNRGYRRHFTIAE
jgi:hypothetical protein